MKKHFLFAAAVAALMTCACSVEPVDVNNVQPEEDGEFTVLTAGFAGDTDETRTVRQADGKVFWSPADAISIIRGTSESGHKKFVADILEPSPTTTFTGTMPSGTAAYWAVYPYKADDYFDGTFLVTTLPGVQEAVAGSFADNLFISTAYVSNATRELTFHHQCGGIKFTVTQPGIKRVTLFPADEGVYLAGLIGLYAASAGDVPFIYATGYEEDMFNTLELSAPDGQTLEVGAAYHFVTLPAYLPGGFSLLFEKEDGSIGSRTIDKDVFIEEGHFATLMEVDKGVTFKNDYLVYSPKVISLDGLGGLFSIDVNGTLEHHIDVNSDWIHAVLESGDARINRRYAYRADRNEEGAERTGMLSICYGENCYPIMVTQSALGDLKVYPHHTLGMRFTATWCQHCPTMHETFQKAKEALGDAFEYICLYGTSGNYGIDESDELADYYLISGYPSGIIDGWYHLPNYTSTDYGASVISWIADQTSLYYPTATALGIESTLSGRDLTVKVDVKAQYEEGYKLTVFLCENEIIGEQRKGSTVVKDFNHSRVARMCLTAATGDEFDGPAAGGVKSLDYTTTIPSGYKTENMEVVAYVQRNLNGRPSVQSAHYGDWYIDNCRSAALGATAPLEVE